MMRKQETGRKWQKTTGTRPLKGKVAAANKKFTNGQFDKLTSREISSWSKTFEERRLSRKQKAN
jgi:hypothetical protein